MTGGRDAVTAADAGLDERARVSALVRRFGWNATSFQVLEPGYRYFFLDPDACVAYVDTASGINDVGVIAATLALPFLPFAPLLGLTPLPLFFLGPLALIVAMYIFSAELAKRTFYRHFEPSSARAPSGLATS